MTAPVGSPEGSANAGNGEGWGLRAQCTFVDGQPTIDQVDRIIGGSALQWNPSDDRCDAGVLVIQRGATQGWRLSGEIAQL